MLSLCMLSGRVCIVYEYEQKMLGLSGCGLHFVVDKFAENKIIAYLQRAVLLSAFYKGADKSLARPRRKRAIATEDFKFHISYL